MTRRKMIMKQKIFSLIAMCLLFLVSCQERHGYSPDGAGGTVVARISGYEGVSSSADEEESLSGMAGFHFEKGSLKYIYESFGRTDEGYDLKTSSLDGTLYIVAWTGEQMPFSLPAIGTPEEQWLAVSVTGEDMFFTGETLLTGAGGSALPVTLRRGMARFDLRVEVAGEAVVHSAVIRNSLARGWLFPQPELSAVSPALAGDVELAPGAFIHEQLNPELTAVVSARIDGREYVLEAPLPSEVLRNTRYSVTLRQDSITREVSLEVIPWGDGGTSDAQPDRSGALSIDTERSGLPAGAVLSDDGRTLTLSHHPADFTLAIAADEELELVSADGYLLEVSPVPASGVSDMNAFRIRKSLYAPGVQGEDVEVSFRRKSMSGVYPDDRIVVRLSPNPTVVSGPMDFDTEGYRHDFGRYVDNELGVFTLPEGSTLSVEFAEGESPWVMAEPVGGNSWRVLGGWRPNDPTADGRSQQAVIVVSDGAVREEYTVVRRNYGLPVVWMHGIWWCKYNSMGVSTDFEDQILVPQDPAAAAGQTLFDYLASCSPEEYRSLWQWAYQGSSGRGMKVVEQDGILVMDGFSMDVSDHINRLPADALSPDGYELPSMEDFNRIFDATDYVWIMWNGTHTLKNPWEGHSLVKRENRRKNDVTVDGMVISDLISIAMWSPDYPEHEPVVWYGPGAQWNADGIKHAGHYNNILFGVYSPEGSGWYMAGGMNAFYLHKNGAGNRDTRILRFKKSDVEYIY